MAKSLVKWLNEYEKKTKTEIEYRSYASLLFDAEHGFVFVSPQLFFGEKVLMVHESCGNGHYWQERVMEIARKEGIKKLATLKLINKNTNVDDETYMKSVERNLRAYRKQYSNSAIVGVYLTKPVE